MSPSSEDPILLCCLLWAHEGKADALHAYEDHVLRLIREHGGEVVQRGLADTPGQPDEVQLLRFPGQSSLDGYLDDERRTSLAVERDTAVARTEVFPVRLTDRRPAD